VSIGCPHHPPVTTETPRVAPKSIGDPDERSIPPELLETMRRTVAYALDFILDTLDYSPDEPLVPANEVDLRVQPSADPMMKDQYCVVLWNDDKHSFDDVIKLLCDTTGRTREEANEVAIKVDDQGREVIDMNANIIRLLETARTFSQIDLGVTVRRAYDTFREQIVVVIIDWLLDITRSRLGTDTGIMREIISKQLVAPRRSGSLHPNVEAAKIVSDVQNPARLDWMFLYHTRLWKKPRLNLKEVYASVLSLSHEHKMGVGTFLYALPSHIISDDCVASHFANVYHRIIDSYLLVDREAETSIKYFALQLFTVPSIALHIVRKHNLINRLSSIITAFFTNQIKDKRIIHPADSNASVDVEAFPFKSKRFMPVFSDLRYLCHNEPVQDLIAHNRDFILLFSKTCQLFMCINPNKRAANSHVEYETDAWISVFNVTLSLSRVIKVYGEAFSRATIAELVAAITTVMHDILVVCTLSNDRLDREKFSAIAFHDVTFGENSYSVVEFDVLEGWVSFHHSLQWLLAELFKHIDILTEDNLKEIGLSSIRDVCLRNASEQAVLTIIDFPLRGKWSYCFKSTA
jgi:E3 ubiquitin-protein ligase UBR1